MPKTKSTYSQVKYKKDGTVKKHGSISEKKFDRKSKRYSKQEGSKSLGTNTSKGQQVVAGKGKRKSVSRTTVAKKEPTRAAAKKAAAKKAMVAAAKKAATKKYTKR
jgi:hypothetical protein|tara:strand:- start:620 stop:937 length:318 start_codon:yes stop_codon:yes gene_type:complete